MKLYAISDLHLSFITMPDPGLWTAREHKPMSVMDDIWEGHAQKIYNNWNKIIEPSDIVFVSGDISWAMKLEEALTDLGFLGMLPGNIIAIPGNHDYWWQSISKVRAVLPPNVKLIQNNCMMLGNVAICGSRGWTCPRDTYFKDSDDKIYRRELIRMENSLQCVPPGVSQKIVLMHYMPTNEKHQPSGFIELFKKYKVNAVVYGHLHSKACSFRLPDSMWGIRFYLTSADFLGFAPLLVAHEEEGGQGVVFSDSSQLECPLTRPESV